MNDTGMLVLIVVLVAGIVTLTVSALVRIAFLPFSKRVRGQVRKHPFLHTFWFLIAGLLLLSFLLIPMEGPSDRKQTIKKLRAVAPVELLAACRTIMADAHTFTNDSEVMPWHADWQATVNRDSIQYRRKLPPVIRDLSPVCVRIATNQVYLFYWNSPFRLAVRAFAPGAEQFGTERLCDGLWIVTQAED